MKRFNYKAKDKETGKILKGSIQAENERIAGRLLIEQGYIPQSVFRLQLLSEPLPARLKLKE